MLNKLVMALLFIILVPYNAKSQDSIETIALSAQVALFKRLEIIATNVANASTPGFKQKKILFTMHEVKTSDEKNKIVSYVNDISTYRDYAGGDLRVTSGTFDLALVGPGYFMVTAPSGNHFTRDGNFFKMPNGTLVTKQGYPVMSNQRNNIVIPPQAQIIEISDDGSITADSILINRVGVFTFQNQNNLKEAGQSMYKIDEALNPPQDPVANSYKVAQGFLEGSNVNKVAAIADLIDTQNHARTVSVIMAAYDDITRKALTSLSSTQ